ncbi:serine/threonine-protein kinase pim-1-like [Cyclopterus lumpus]|uniref:serine/threonine-protein kinase pim-1-like n=1 Tax=Cyclopterus lumpus TaxID=8103 RepID=UPI0014860D7A|nr:serine/threonine-protein kinase pim-1-like [Cyclopterus lumpus]XP_034416795.1 serine/threonine-protein kinase pim-1-like [Cyclopterus lumpus]
MSKVLGKLFKAEEKDVVPGEGNTAVMQDEESPQRGDSRRLDPILDLIPRKDELTSSSEDISVVPGGLKRKRTEDGEILQREKSRRLDPMLDPMLDPIPDPILDLILDPMLDPILDLIPCEYEFPSTSEDISVVPGGLKRKRTEDGEILQREKSRRLDPILDPMLDPILCNDELPSTSEDTESRNPPEAALSARSADDGPVQKDDLVPDPSAMFKAKYQQQEKLGEGGYGCVYAGYRREDNLPVAIKHIMIDEELLFHEDSDGLQIPMEVAVLRKLEAQSEQHSASIDLLDWYVVDQELILVLERPMPAVDLFDYIQDKGGYLKEKEAKIIMKQLVDAAIDLQEKHIFHRDIKTENLLIETGMKLPRVRVIDFGLSCFSEEDDVYSTFYGTDVPPEWASRQEYKAGPTTVFQIGMVLFYMRKKVSFRPGMTFVKLNETKWLSKNGKDFFKACICEDPDTRFTLDQLKHHRWLR